jgi:hypothetical protein
MVHLQKEKKTIKKIGKAISYAFRAVILIFGFVFFFLKHFPRPFEALNNLFIVFCFGFLFFTEFFELLKWLVRLGERIGGRKNGRRKQ